MAQSLSSSRPGTMVPCGSRPYSSRLSALCFSTWALTTWSGACSSAAAWWTGCTSDPSGRTWSVSVDVAGCSARCDSAAGTIGLDVGGGTTSTWAGTVGSWTTAVWAVGGRTTCGSVWATGWRAAAASSPGTWTGAASTAGRGAASALVTDSAAGGAGSAAGAGAWSAGEMAVETLGVSTTAG